MLNGFIAKLLEERGIFNYFLVVGWELAVGGCARKKSPPVFSRRAEGPEFSRDCWGSDYGPGFENRKSFICSSLSILMTILSLGLRRAIVWAMPISFLFFI